MSKSSAWLKGALGAVAGGVAGFLFYKFFGCKSG